MAIKKPSDFFKKDTVEVSNEVREHLPENFNAYKDNIKNIEVLNEFVSSFGSLKENIQKVYDLESTIQSLKEDLQNAIKKEDLDNAIVSNLLVLEKNIKRIELNLKGINRNDIRRIDEEIGEIEDKVLFVLENEFPKYKKSLKKTEIDIKEKFFDYSNEVNHRLKTFEDFIEISFDEIKENLQAINEEELLDITSAVINTSNEVKNQNQIIENLTSKTKKKIFGIEKDIQEFYQKIQNTIHEYQENQESKILSLEDSISSFGEDEVKKYQKLLQETKIQNDEKILEFERNLTEKYNQLTNSVTSLLENVENKSFVLEETLQDKVNDLENSLKNSQNILEETSQDYKKLIKSIEAKGLSENKKFEDYQNNLNQISNLIEKFNLNLEDIQETYSKKEDYDKELSELRYHFTKKLNLLENDIQFKENKIKEKNQELVDEIQNIRIQFEDLNLKQIEEKYSHLTHKISYIEGVFDNFNEKSILNEGFLTEPPELKNSDSLTPLNKNFVTLDQLQEHYRLFINRVQQQLATIGGGGETRLEFLDDVDRNSAKNDGYVLSYQASTGKFIGTEISGGGESFWSSTSSGISTISNVGIGITADPNYKLYVEGDAFFTGNISVAGTVTYDDVTNIDSIGFVTARSGLLVGSATTFAEDLVVEGDARVTGILTVGTASVVIDGDNNTITAGDIFITGSSITIGENVTIDAGATGINSAPNVLYVAKDGNDAQNGTSIDNAKLTIAGAVAIATTGTIIKVLSGTYNENNPIEVPAFVSIVGDSLKTVTIVPNNSTEDIFHVNKGTYLAHMTFTGHVSPSAAVAFPPNIAENVGGGDWESPYVQNCTSNTTTGTGMRIDGSLAEGLKSMVVDAYTQYNQGGVGIAITNNGYAQLVSVFTICCDKSITAYKGGQCSLTNSNTSFGTLGLVADGVSDLQFTGTASTASVGQPSVNVAITTTTRPYEGQVVYFGTLYNTINTIEVTNGGSGYVSTPSVSIEAPTGPNGTTATAFATLDGDSVVSITIISSGSQYTSAPEVTISAPDSGVTATATASISPIYYTINSSTPIVDGVTTITLEENLNNTIGSGSTAYFYQVSRITATSHTFEYVGSGNEITSAIPSRGGVPIQENEIIETNGGKVTFTSTDQAGNFRIGNDIVINQNNGTISGRAFTRSLFNQMTPFILALS